MLGFTLPDLLADTVERAPGSPALARDGTVLSYAELADRVEEARGRLASLGLERGERICLHLVKSIDEVVLTHAASSLGLVVVNINAIVTVRQLRHALGHSRAAALVTGARKVRALLDAAPDSVPGTLREIVTLDAPVEGSRLFTDLEPVDHRAVRVVGADPCVVMYTSGSTGPPKGVLLTHQTVVQSARAAARHLGNRPDDRAIGVLPLSFDFGLSQLTTMTLVGGCLVLPRATIPTEVLAAIEEHQVNALAMVPTMWIPLVRLLQKQERVLAGIRYVANSGGPLPTDVKEAWPEVFPEARHYLMYGMTEGFRSTYLPPEDFVRKPGSVGVPLPDVEIYVVGPDGVCGPGEVGEIVHRSSSLLSSGYLDDPAATSEKIRPCPQLRHLIGDEPVLWSGDTGYLDEDGYLYFVARTSTFIKCSDFRVSPTEVEDVCFSSGLVTDVVAFGRPDETLGQVVEVAVSVADADAFSPEAVIRHARRELPPYAVPRRVHVWPAARLPLTANGKVDRPRVIDACLGADPVQ